MEIKGSEIELKMIFKILNNHSSDFFGCEPICREPGRTCKECLQKDIKWICTDYAGWRTRKDENGKIIAYYKEGEEYKWN